MISKDDSTYLTWSAERLLLLIGAQEDRRAYLEKKAVLWCSGLLVILGALTQQLLAQVGTVSAVQALFAGAGLLITSWVFVDVFRVARAQVTAGITPEQFAGEEVLASTTSGALQSLNKHLVLVHTRLGAEIDSKGLLVLGLQARALVGALCYLVAGYLHAIGA